MNPTPPLTLLQLSKKPDNKARINQISENIIIPKGKEGQLGEPLDFIYLTILSELIIDRKS